MVSNAHVSTQQVTGGNGYVILGTEANEQQALSYGCIVEEPSTHKVYGMCVYFISPVWEKEVVS